MKNIVFALLFISTFLNVLAQKNPEDSNFEVEIDPIAFALQGYSFHGIYLNSRIRTDLGVFGIMQPVGFNGNEGFQIKTQGVGVKVNYLLTENETWFTGIGLGYSTNRINLLESSEVQNQKIIGIGAHLGYRWFMFENASNALRNLYLAPWFSIDYNIPINDVSFETKNYNQQIISFFPTIHIGYKI
ncbi:MAG: hypothetical protein CVV25_01980 [Ignavibacteriae bacterium HGW-Ignavibacteriae-4]|jgi:hypothetical protein|nr:MAG: hypothetical protein CVV25_01980 [Ignavibacteriae bacterium HGW-Ignavibacteriae-4]